MILVYILIGLIAGIRIASLFMGNALVPAGYYTTYDLVVKTASVFTTAVDYAYFVTMYATNTVYAIIQPPSRALVPVYQLVSTEKNVFELPYIKCIVAALLISLVLQCSCSCRKPSRR